MASQLSLERRHHRAQAEMDAIESSAASALSQHGLGSSPRAARRAVERSPRDHSDRAERVEQRQQQQGQEQHQQQASGRRISDARAAEADARRFYDMLEGEAPRKRGSGAGASSLPPALQQPASPRSAPARSTKMFVQQDAQVAALKRVRERARAARAEAAAERSEAEDRRRRNEGAAYLQHKIADYRVKSRSKREHEAECDVVEELAAAQDKALNAMLLRGMFLPQQSGGTRDRSNRSRDLDREVERIVERKEDPERLGFASCSSSRSG
jgi:hypothetical protein